MKRATATITLLALAGCATTSAPLPPAPPRDAPLVERAQHYERVRPRFVRGGSGSFVLLPDGTRIDDASALSANVDATSATAQAATRATVGHALARILGVTSATLAVAGTAAITAGDLSLRIEGPGNADLLHAAVVGVGLATVLMGGFAGAAALVTSAAADTQTEVAMITYDASLRAHLGLPRGRGPDVAVRGATLPLTE